MVKANDTVEIKLLFLENRTSFFIYFGYCYISVFVCIYVNVSV